MEKILITQISGDLGNLLFTIASSYLYSKKEEVKLRILKTNKDKDYPVYWETLLKKIKPYLIEEIEEIEEISLKSLNQNNFKDFRDNREEIKKIFKSDSFLVNFVKNKYNKLIEEKDRVVVVYSDDCKNLNYYKKAINEFINNKPRPLFLLCVKEENIIEELKNFINTNNSEYYILKDDELLTFTLLQHFNNFIISYISYNSFIWWCVWLSEYKYVIVSESRDIYEKDWIVIN